MLLSNANTSSAKKKAAPPPGSDVVYVDSGGVILNANPKTLDINVPAGTKLLCVAVGQEHTSLPSVSAITAEGVAPSGSVTIAHSNNFNRGSIYYWWDPPTGAAVTISVSITVGSTGSFAWSTFDGDDLDSATAPLSDSDNASSVSEISNVVDTTPFGVGNALVVGAVFTGSATATYTVDASPAGEQVETPNTYIVGSSSGLEMGHILDSGAAGNQTVAWQISGSIPAVQAIALAFKVIV